MKRLLCLLLLCLAGAQAGAAAKLPYTYARVGHAGDANNIALQGGTVLMGGSTDVDAAFRWLCARSQGGDVLVIRATGTDAYNPYIQALCPLANSVATLVIPSTTAANHPDVARLIGQAEAVWIAGGDQSDYINAWTRTPVQTALQARIHAGAPVGGTSAGLNVLTQYVYAAQASKGVTSSQALLDPFNRYMSFAQGFVNLPVLAGSIGDPHFAARDRMGRDLAFLCRLVADFGVVRPKAIAVDEQTALLVEPGGQARVVGSGQVYFLQAPELGPQVCQAGQPLTYRNIAVHRVGPGAGFNLGTWSGSAGLAYTVSAERGALSASNGSIY